MYTIYEIKSLHTLRTFDAGTRPSWRIRRLRNPLHENTLTTRSSPNINSNNLDLGISAPKYGQVRYSGRIGGHIVTVVLNCVKLWVRKFAL